MNCLRCGERDKDLLHEVWHNTYKHFRVLCKHCWFVACLKAMRGEKYYV